MAVNFFEVKDLYLKYFGGYLGVDMVSFSIEKNQIFPIYGKFLSGKTSLLRCIVGLEKYKGTVTFSEDISKEISFTFGFESLKKFQTAKENIIYPLLLRNIVNANEIVESKAKEFGIENLLNVRVKDLNDAQKSLVILVRALVRDCKLYLLDNPLNCLEDNEREIIFNVLKKSLSNKTVVYATNKIDEAFELNSTVGIMAYKKMIQIGTKNELSNMPKNKEVLVALGINDYSVGTLLQNGDGYVIKIEDDNFKSVSPISDIYVNKEVLVPIIDKKIKSNIYFDKNTEYLISKNEV